LTGRITRLIDGEQAGWITGDDGNDYAFTAQSLVSPIFFSLLVGMSVSFTGAGSSGRRKAMSVIVTK
jgi:hypothetical protein